MKVDAARYLSYAELLLLRVLKLEQTVLAKYREIIGEEEVPAAISSDTPTEDLVFYGVAKR